MSKRPFLSVFLPLWLILSFWQACFSQLIPDEAYYWLYSQNLAWGYFDHPPMVGLMIKAGALVFANEWGVRCMAVILSTGTLWLLYKIVQPLHEWLFIAIIVSIVPLHLMLCFAVPDVPLLFFTALFFYAFKKYTLNRGQGQITCALLFIAVVGMFYSKYHAVLTIAFTLHAAPAIFRYRSFYFILIACIAAYMPHIFWEANHKYITIKYQLFERNADRYSFQYTLDYFVGQWALLGPLASFTLLYAAFKHKATNVFERVLLFNLYGFLLFFLVMSCRGHVEPNWTIPCWIPLIILSYRYFESKSDYWQWLKPVAIISFAGIIGIKLLLTAAWADKKWFEFDQFHGWRKWATAIKEKASVNPVVFIRNYQTASEYMFYSGDTAFSHNIPYGRSNQFDYWHYEENMIGKKVMLLSPGWFIQADKSLIIDKDTLGYKWIDRYYGFGKIKLRALDVPGIMHTNEKYQIRVVPENHFINKGIVDTLTSIAPDICYLFDKPGFYMGPESTGVPFNTSNSKDTIIVTVTAPAVPGKYSLFLCFDHNYKIMLATNSERIPVMVEDSLKGQEK
jgi:hypothetical protein